MIARDPKIARLRQLESYLRSHIRGQDHVIVPVASALADAELGLAPPGRPKASFLFVGPTGTGKTELTLTFTDYLYGRDHLLRFDLSEYQGDGAVGRLLGADRSDPGLSGRSLDAVPFGTLLFDEVEKSHPTVADLFLQIVDAGRITVATGKTYSLDPYVVAFTTNVGSAEAMRMERSTWSSIESATLRRVREHFRPELVNRFSEKCVFRRLGPSTQHEICCRLVEREMNRLNGLGHRLTIGSGVVEFLVRHGHDPEQGARPPRRTVEKHLQCCVRQSLFSRGIAEGIVVPGLAGLQLTDA